MAKQQTAHLSEHKTPLQVKPSRPRASTGRSSERAWGSAPPSPPALLRRPKLLGAPPPPHTNRLPGCRLPDPAQARRGPAPRAGTPPQEAGGASGPRLPLSPRGGGEGKRVPQRLAMEPPPFPSPLLPRTFPSPQRRGQPSGTGPSGRSLPAPARRASWLEIPADAHGEGGAGRPLGGSGRC